MKLNFKPKTNTIKTKLILLPLLLIIITMTGVGFISSYFIEQSLRNEMKSNGIFVSSEFIDRMEDNNKAITTINQMLDSKIKTAGKTVIRRNELTNDFLKILAFDSEIKEINVFDPSGKIINSNVDDYLGVIVPDGHPVMDVIKGDKSEYIEEVRKDTYSDLFLKYGYIKSANGNTVQVGILANIIQTLTYSFDKQRLITEMASNNEIAYVFLLDNNNNIIAHNNKDNINTLYQDSENIISTNNPQISSRNTKNEEDNKNVYEITVPIITRGEYLGAMVIGYSMENIEKSINDNIIIVTITGLTAILLLGFTLFNTSNSAVKTINKMKEQIGYMASGDFSKEISSNLLNKKDEFGQISQAIDTMQKSTRDIVKHILDNSNHLAASAEELNAISQQSATAADEIAKTIGEIAQGANSQAQETEQGSLSILELGDLIIQNDVHIDNLNTSTEKVLEIKEEGLHILNELVLKTEINRKSSKEVQQVIINTNNSASKIYAASDMIKSIANQTNLLALNAAIEAARAGEHGKGFAVVADEIRKLADASNKFTDQISSIINDLSKETTNAVETMEELEKVVNSQAESVVLTSNKFEAISLAIEDMKNLIHIVNESSDVMTQKKEALIHIIESLSAISEENAASTEEISASVEEQSASTIEIANSIEELAKISEELQAKVEQFKIN